MEPPWARGRGRGRGRGGRSSPGKSYSQGSSYGSSSNSLVIEMGKKSLINEKISLKGESSSMSRPEISHRWDRDGAKYFTCQSSQC